MTERTIEQKLEMANIRIGSLDALLRMHRCNVDNNLTVHECVGIGSCGCSCGLLLGDGELADTEKTK